MSHEGSDGLTFAFVDLAGFTALTEVHGDHDAADLIDHFGTLAREALDVDDRLVKTIGDAVMLVCLTPSAGLRLVRRITAACLTQPRFPVPRAGLHHGPAVERHDDFVGAAVNLAARVTAQATEATAVVTATIEPAARQLGWSIAPLGYRLLHNLSEPVELWEIPLDERYERIGIDPVCRMRVTPDQVLAQIRYHEIQYQFCSLGCASAFIAAPERYSAASATCPPARK